MQKGGFVRKDGAMLAAKNRRELLLVSSQKEREL